MKRYSKRGKEADRLIQDQLDLICAAIKKACQPLSIILIGGFGRGEGGVLIKEGKYIPVNDYDLYVITNEKISTRNLEQLSLRLTSRLGKKGVTFKGFDKNYTIEKTFYPDIRSATLKKLRHLPPLLKYFEMRESGLVLAGEDLLGQIPEIKIADVPLQEGFRFLMNRLSLQAAFFSREPEKRDGLINFMSKTALSCAEALLLLSGRYVASYEGRAKVLQQTFRADFPQLACQAPGLADFVREMTDFKLLPDYERVTDLMKKWLQARDYALIVLSYYLKKVTGEKAETPDQAAEFINNKYWRTYLIDYVAIYLPRSLVLAGLASLWLNVVFAFRILWKKKQLYLVSLKRFWVSPELKIYAAGLMFAYSYSQGKIDQKRLALARDYLREVFPVSSQGFSHRDWEDFRQEFGDAFSLYEHLKAV